MLKRKNQKRRNAAGTLVGAALLAGSISTANPAFAGTVYNSTTDASWFNGTNWSANPALAADDDIFGGQGYTNLTPNGVVFDPVNDPNFGQTYTFGTGAANSNTFTTVAQVYLSGGSTSTAGAIAGKLTLLTGTLTVNGGSTGVAIGRPQITNTNTSENATLVLNGGSLITTASNGDISLSNSQTNGTALTVNQTNVLDYTNTSSLTATSKNAGGLRLDPANIAAANTFNSTVILRHTSTGTGTFTAASVVSGANSTVAGTSNNTFEFHYGGGNVDTVNVGNGLAGNKLALTNATGTGGGAIKTFLSLILDQAPTVDGVGVPQNLGLFKVDDSTTGITPNTAGASPSSAANEFNGLAEGATVSANFGSGTYSWQIYYDGNISGSTITGQATGNDVVLIGLSSAVPEPASLGLLALTGLGLLGRRRKV